MSKAFDKDKYHPGTKEFTKAWKKLCDETPTMEATCRRIRRNQELYLEYQQKCLNKYDPTIQKAVECAGDIIRELTKYGCKAYDLNYVDEKLRRLRRRVDDLATR